jgi:hypothetical protein
MTEHKELRYPDRQELSEDESATLVYENLYSGTVVEKEVQVTDITGRVSLQTERGAEWGIFGSTIRTSVNNRRQSGTVKPKNGRPLGYLVEIRQ